MIVRPARPGDEHGIATVQVRTWQEAYSHVFGRERLATLDVERSGSGWGEQLAAPAPRSTILVADRAGDVVGFVAIGPSRDADAADETGEIYAIYVLPAEWGSGVGNDLHAAALAALRDAGFRDAALWVLEDNPRARRFYEREGWALDGGRMDAEILGVPVAEVRYRRGLAESA